MYDTTPIEDVKELLQWDESMWDNSRTKELKNYRKTEGPELLVCHDFKYGYLDEERWDGYKVPANENPLVLLNWWNIDLFCYFTHHFVTIPPVAYINLAHEHDKNFKCIPVLGTLITGLPDAHQTDGRKLCAQFLDTQEHSDAVVDMLVRIAKHHKFEGWLINIELDLKPTWVANLPYFLRQLTEKMKEINLLLGANRVVWYDTVIENGTLDWQNQLNTKNKIFYDNCDGIYLNYQWTEDDLTSSLKYGEAVKIYAGIDVWGRNCIGGFNSSISQSIISRHKMSTAIFAPGWASQTFPKEDPIQIGLKFWDQFFHLFKRHPILELPFETDFRAGFSRQDNNDTWFRLRSISPQSQFVASSLAPLPEGGLLIKDSGYHKLFLLDCEVPNLHIQLNSSNTVTVLVNDSPISAISSSCSEFFVDGPLHLRTIDVITTLSQTIIHSIKIQDPSQISISWMERVKNVHFRNAEV